MFIFNLLRFSGPHLWNSSRLAKVPIETTLYFFPTYSLNLTLTKTPRKISEQAPMIPTPRVPTPALRFPISVFAHTVPSTWKALPTSQILPTLTTHLKRGPLHWTIPHPFLHPDRCAPIPPLNLSLLLLGHTLTHFAMEVLMQRQDSYVIIL